jgi:serine/threonine protein kinase
MANYMLGERYKIVQHLGKKAGRRTILARDLQSTEQVVIKLLSLNDDFEWDDLELFEREALTLKTLKHPAIPSYIDYFEINTPEQKGFALVQSYIPVPTLEQYLNTGRTFTETEVKQIARQILEILIYLHEQNLPVIHSDIKPSNILIDLNTNTNPVFLIGFDCVKKNTLSNLENTVLGTYGYMAPEQFEGTAVPASDLYSLGATLIHLVTGTHPANLLQTDLQIEFSELTSSSLSTWLQWMTQPSLQQRPDSARYSLEVLDVPHLLKLKSSQLVSIKATGSKIQLSKSIGALSVLIPPSGFDTAVLFLALFAVAWNAGVFAWTVSALSMPAPINIPLALFSLPFWGVGCFIIYWVLFSLFGKTRLQINQNYIALTYELFGFKYHQSRPGVNEYRLAVNKGNIKSQVELEWLAHEVSNWLDMPIDPPKIDDPP